MAEGLPHPTTAAVGRAVRITAAVEGVMEVQAESFKKRGCFGSLFVLLSFTYLFASPIDWKMFLEALIFGSIIGALPHIICYAGDTVLIAIKEFLDMI